MYKMDKLDKLNICFSSTMIPTCPDEVSEYSRDSVY